MSRALIYVHLQNDLPEIFWCSIKKARELWKGDIYLVAPQRESYWERLKEYNVIFVSEESLQNQPTIHVYESLTFFPAVHKGWNNFWDNACKRFMYLYLIMRDKQITETIHLETDVVPYIDIETMFNKFKNIYSGKIVFSPHAPYQHSCCFMYCDGLCPISNFRDAILEYFRRGYDYFVKLYPSQPATNETNLAYLFCEEYKEITDLFPTTETDRHSSDLGFWIDSTDWGEWINGVHYIPGIQYAAKGHFIGDRLLQGCYDILFSFKNERIYYPYVYVKAINAVYPLATLHFNSKRAEKWI